MTLKARILPSNSCFRQAPLTQNRKPAANTLEPGLHGVDVPTHSKAAEHSWATSRERRCTASLGRKTFTLNKHAYCVVRCKIHTCLQDEAEPFREILSVGGGFGRCPRLQELALLLTPSVGKPGAYRFKVQIPLPSFQCPHVSNLILPA